MIQKKEARSLVRKYILNIRDYQGLLVIACRHKVCYGFEILRNKESTIVF